MVEVVESGEWKVESVAGEAHPCHNFSFSNKLENKGAIWLLLRTILILSFCCYGGALFAQTISIKLTDPRPALLHIDSANWNEAWIEVDGARNTFKKLRAEDLIVTDDERVAKIISIDSIGSKFGSHLALSFMLDNSGSMFHAYDSLTRMCDSIIAGLSRGVLLQAVTFDTKARSESHLYTKRPSVFIAQTGFRDSIAPVSTFWHFFDTIRTQYTPLYDAIAAVVGNINDRRMSGDIAREDVVIVVTDGEDNASRASIEMLNDLVSTARVRLFAINFRTAEDARLLWLTHRAGGEFYTAENLHDLRALLKEIGSSLTRKYHIQYRFPSLTPSSSGK